MPIRANGLLATGSLRPNSVLVNVSLLRTAVSLKPGSVSMRCLSGWLYCLPRSADRFHGGGQLVRQRDEGWRVGCLLGRLDVCPD